MRFRRVVGAFLPIWRLSHCAVPFTRHDPFCVLVSLAARAHLRRFLAAGASRGLELLFSATERILRQVWRFRVSSNSSAASQQIRSEQEQQQWERFAAAPREEAGPPSGHAERRRCRIGPTGVNQAIDQRVLASAQAAAPTFGLSVQHSQEMCMAGHGQHASEAREGQQEQAAELSRGATAEGAGANNVLAWPSLQTCPPLAGLEDELRRSGSPGDVRNRVLVIAWSPAVSCASDAVRAAQNKPQAFVVALQHHPTLCLASVYARWRF